MNSLLKISAFKDISAFVLTQLAQESNIALEVKLDIKYVKNADEAHQDLIQRKSDIVLMSYDDTLSIALKHHFSEILALLPIHGGILDLCGHINIAGNQKNIGIDTDSGYARALRFYLKIKYSPKDYERLTWVKAGATNLRYEQLKAGSIDATLLNPPFSYLCSGDRDPGFQDFLGDYQGVVLNIHKTMLQDGKRKGLLSQFIEDYKKIIQKMESDSEETIKLLAQYYDIGPEDAVKIYTRLWQPNGLNTTFRFQDSALTATEKIFSQDTHISVPRDRHWILNYG
ncbi:hypothetical protein L3556_11775 [Candidatus Synechococcus calcipolaris G9]|uniref:SsuA/THI5-like domain-containing protein n=1 Tax=Candidatus Synechococcus calcipolaris G9 TaxID=1497997 RepID=A0ABT6F195_9SYNE|nr:hypothetical protein [Candidatus Synechococcus calcipolaris]MDG2991604.1 hypothetical protein [Candidatus Synechococcus calcipolaris G9]